jgi:predicted nucleotidyltransferase
MKVLEAVSKELIQLEGVDTVYLGGSRAYGGETESSDWDFFGVVDSNYGFDREENLNKRLSEEVGRDIQFRGISVRELQDGDQEGIITKYVPIEVLMKSFSSWIHLAGENYSLDDFKVKPASIQEEKGFYIQRLTKNRDKAEEEDLPFPFRDYVKTVLLLINSNQVSKGAEYTLNYQKIAARSSGVERKLASLCMNFRTSRQSDREKFFDELDRYLKRANTSLDSYS